jgi:outer membrane protein assembly factor BamB
MERREKPVSVVPILLALATICAAAFPVFAQAPDFATVWEKHFTEPIVWSSRTSGGILIVRTAKTLTAVDRDGKQLWTIPDIDIGKGPEADVVAGYIQQHVYEVPGIPILLLDRAKLSNDDSEHLLGVNLATGTVAWQLPALNDPLQVFPLYKSNRVLLVANKARVLNQPLLILLDPLTGHEDWSTEATHFLFPGLVQLSEWNGQDYLYTDFQLVPSALARIDLSNGKGLWEFREKNYQQPPRDGTLLVSLPAPVFAGGLVVYAAKNLFGLDPATGKTIWTAGNLGKIKGMQVIDGLVVGAGDKGAFAVDGSSGAVKWKLPIDGRATDSFYSKEKNALVYCDNSDLVMVDASTGAIIRRTPHHLGEDVRFAGPIGKKLFFVEGDEKAVFVNLETGETVESLPRQDFGRVSTSFLLSQPPFDFIEKLKDDRRNALANNGQGEITDPELLRLESSLAVPVELVGKAATPGVIDYWLLNGDTGAVKKFSLEGGSPIVDPSFARIYLVEHGDTLRAVDLPAN